MVIIVFSSGGSNSSALSSLMDLVMDLAIICSVKEIVDDTLFSGQTPRSDGWTDTGRYRRRPLEVEEEGKANLKS